MNNNEDLLDNNKLNAISNKEVLFNEVNNLIEKLFDDFNKESIEKSFYHYDDDVRSYSDDIKDILGIDRFIYALEDANYLDKIDIKDNKQIVIDVVHEILQQAKKSCDYTEFDLITSDRDHNYIQVGYNEDEIKWYRNMGDGRFESDDHDATLYPVYVLFRDEKDSDYDEYIDIGLTFESDIEKRVIDVDLIINKLNILEDKDLNQQSLDNTQNNRIVRSR